MPVRMTLRMHFFILYDGGLYLMMYIAIILGLISELLDEGLIFCLKGGNLLNDILYIGFIF